MHARPPTEGTLYVYVTEFTSRNVTLLQWRREGLWRPGQTFVLSPFPAAPEVPAD